MQTIKSYIASQINFDSTCKNWIPKITSKFKKIYIFGKSIEIEKGLVPDFFCCRHLLMRYLVLKGQDFQPCYAHKNFGVDQKKISTLKMESTINVCAMGDKKSTIQDPPVKAFF